MEGAGEVEGEVEGEESRARKTPPPLVPPAPYSNVRRCSTAPPPLPAVYALIPPSGPE